MNWEKNINYKFIKIFEFIFVVFIFISFYPHILGSETLQITTYYPAPYGGYARLLTTDETALARDNANSRVIVGENDTAINDIKMVIRGGILKIADNNIPVNQAPPGGNAGGFANRIWIQNSGGSFILMSRDANNYVRIGLGGGDPSIAFTGDLFLNSTTGMGRITGLCTLRPYPGWCGANEVVWEHYGDGVARSTWWACSRIANGSCDFYSTKTVGWDWAGQMLCCRIATF